MWAAPSEHQMQIHWMRRATAKVQGRQDVNACMNIRHVGIGLEEHGEAPLPLQTWVQPAMLIVASRRWVSKDT